jgi:hypothetical protein
LLVTERNARWVFPIVPAAALIPAPATPLPPARYEARNIPVLWGAVPGIDAATLPRWSTIGSSTTLAHPTLGATAILEDGTVAMATLAAMRRTRPLTREALATQVLADMRPLGRPLLTGERGTAHTGGRAFPLPVPPLSTVRAGRTALFPDTDRVRPIERTHSAECAAAPTDKERLRMQQNILLDALQDMRDIGQWSDAETVAVNNTLVTAADTANGPVTRGLARSMPLPVCLAWGAEGDVLHDPCTCDACRLSGTPTQAPLG